MGPRQQGQDQDSNLQDQDTRSQDQDSNLQDQDTRSQDQDSNLQDQDTKSQDQDSIPQDQDSKILPRGFPSLNSRMLSRMELLRLTGTQTDCV